MENKIKQDVMSAVQKNKISYNTAGTATNGTVVHYYTVTTADATFTFYKSERFEKSVRKTRGFKLTIKYASGELTEIKDALAQEMYDAAQAQYNNVLHKASRPALSGYKTTNEATTKEYLQIQREIYMAKKKAAENAK
jgi:hypothetical protein